MRSTIFLLFLSLLLISCSSDTGELAASQTPVRIEGSTSNPAAPSSTPVPATATTSAELSPVEVQPEEPAPAPPPTEAATAEPAPSPTEALVYNGPYEQTYFRGAAGAPVTIIDYSDFL